MKINNKIKEKKVLTLYILGILILLISVVGLSYAAWTYNFLGVKTSTISTASISLKFLEDSEEVININNALPLTDDEGKLQDDTYNFAVTSKTIKDTTVNYTISIEKLECDVNYTPLADNQVKVYLEDYNYNELVAPTLVSALSNYALYTGSQVHNSSTETVQHKFRFRTWIDESLLSTAVSWDQDTKIQYKFKLVVNGSES